jgi:hypothetical protein
VVWDDGEIAAYVAPAADVRACVERIVVQQRDLPAITGKYVLIFVDSALYSRPAYSVALEAQSIVAGFGGEAVD